MKKPSTIQIITIIFVAIILFWFYKGIISARDQVISQSSKTDSIMPQQPEYNSNGYSADTSVKVQQKIKPAKKQTKPKYEDPQLGPEPNYGSYSDRMQAIYAKVSYQAEQQFFIAKREGDLMQIYTQASLVCAAYLQARDEVNYNKWKIVEKHYARKIGL